MCAIFQMDQRHNSLIKYVNSWVNWFYSLTALLAGGAMPPNRLTLGASWPNISIKSGPYVTNIPVTIVIGSHSTKHGRAAGPAARPCFVL